MSQQGDLQVPRSENMECVRSVTDTWQGSPPHPSYWKVRSVEDQSVPVKRLLPPLTLGNRRVMRVVDLYPQGCYKWCPQNEGEDCPSKVVLLGTQSLYQIIETDFYLLQYGGSVKTSLKEIRTYVNPRVFLFVYLRDTGGWENRGEVQGLRVPCKRMFRAEVFFPLDYL